MHIMNKSLQEGVENLLQQLKDSKEVFQPAYDDCLWRIVTSSKEDLGEFVKTAWEEPYYSLPAPILCTIARIYGLESIDDKNAVDAAVQLIAIHCSPEEEGPAAEGMKKLAEHYGSAFNQK